MPFGSTILQAAESIGVHIPTLCHHPDLEMAGLCRICVVEVEGQRTLQAACAYPITQPLKVNTHSRAVRVARRHVLDLLLSEHYGDCYSCVRNGNCELQSLAEEYGVDKFRFGHPEHSMFPVDDSSYSVVRDMDKCIRCRRCVRTCIDLQEVGVYEAANRSMDTRDRHLRGQAAGQRGLHQLRPVHQPLPHRRPARQGRDRGSLEGARRPHQARGHPDRAGAARRHGRVLRPGARHAGHLRDEHGAQAHRLRPRLRHQLHRRPHHHRGRHRAASCGSTRRW